jgi:para-nitrobenzyl esterase
MTAEALLDVAAKQGAPRLPIAIDGYFLPKTVAEIFAAGEQARVPLLAGWNSQESNARGVLGQAEATPENYAKALQTRVGEDAETALKAYPAGSGDEVQQAATALAGDMFIGFSTWKWIDAHARTAGRPTYRYFYSRPRPAMNPGKGTAGPARGAAHSAEIEYAMGNLAGNDVYAWTDEDRKVSEVMQGYFANFVKTGNPNGTGLPEWPALKAGDGAQVMRIDVETRAEPDATRERYLFLDRFYAKK